MSWTAPRTWVAGETVTAAMMNTHVRDNITELDPTTAWVALTLQNSWVNYGASWAAAEYRKTAGIVYVRGLIKDGVVTIGTVITSLPAGFRPALRHVVIANKGGGGQWGRIDYLPNGDVVVENANSDHMSLEAAFPAA